jgi:phage antirepressor YoqD-like protein
MSEITPFEFPETGQPVRTMLRNGEPWFVGGDVTAVLGYGGGARNAITRLPDRMKGVEEINTPGGVQKMTVISEPGVYRLVMRSNLPAAEYFQDWIAEDVVPSIRRTGGYTLQPAAPTHALPRTFAEALRAHADEVEAHEQTKAVLAEIQPKADAWNALADADGDYSVREAAQILDRDPAISTGQNRLFATLRDLGWIDSSGQPYQHRVDSGLMVRRTTSYTHPHTGEPTLSSQVRITAKGVQILRHRLGGGSQVELFEGDL